jgi:hypothetical protein
MHHSVLDAFAVYAQQPGSFPNLQFIGHQLQEFGRFIQGNFLRALSHLMRPHVITVDFRFGRIYVQKDLDWFEKFSRPSRHTGEH